MSTPYRLKNGIGNPPDNVKVQANLDFLESLIFGSWVSNGSFEDWTVATSFANPANGTLIADGWTWRKSGSSAPTIDVSRDGGTTEDPAYAALLNITGAGSSDSIGAVDQGLLYTQLRGEVLMFGCAVNTTHANKVRLKITDGINTAYSSSYHTGSGDFERLQVTLSVSSSATSLTVSVEVTSDFTGAVYLDSASAFVIPVLMTDAAKAFLYFRPLFTREDVHAIGPGKGIICTTPDGTKTYRLFVDNDGTPATTRIT